MKHKHLFSVAPMMDWTDRHCRYFHRLLSQKAVLYTEMVTAEAILHGNRDKILGFCSDEKPVILQIGGSDASKCSMATKIALDYGYDEINLNVGCPSDRVQSGRFGACLMKEVDVVVDIVRQMQAVSSVPVTVKCRIGVDDQDPTLILPDLLRKLYDIGVNHVIIHARKAWLKGLSPKENRMIPPLDYLLVYRMKERFPDMLITINGGIETIEACLEHLKYVDGVMVGRSAYHNPALLCDVDSMIYGEAYQKPDYTKIIQEMMVYCEKQMVQSVPFYSIIKHMLGLFQGKRGARAWRNILSEYGHKTGAKPELLEQAFARVEI